MDDFREWLSDNLRYILLGLGILVTVVLIVLGVRFISSLVSGNDKEDKKEQVEQQIEEETDKPEKEKPEKEKKEKEEKEKTDKETEKVPETTPEVTPEAVEKETPESHLEKNVFPAVNKLISDYYAALGSRDVESLKILVDQLDPAEANSIANSHYIEGYSDIEVYTEPGLTENSYIVYAGYNHKYTGYDTQLPGVSCLYVETSEDGNVYVVAEPDPEQQKLITDVTNSQEVQEFVAARQAAYEDTLAKDPELAAFLSELGVGGSAALEAAVGTTITVKSNCNIREKATSESDKIGELIGGQEVTKIGQDGEWIKISAGELEGYVRGDMFR